MVWLGIPPGRLKIVCVKVYISNSQLVGHDSFGWGVERPFHRGHMSDILQISYLHYDSQQ